MRAAWLCFLLLNGCYRGGSFDPFQPQPIKDMNEKIPESPDLLQDLFGAAMDQASLNLCNSNINPIDVKCGASGISVYCKKGSDQDAYLIVRGILSGLNPSLSLSLNNQIIATIPRDMNTTNPLFLFSTSRSSFDHLMFSCSCNGNCGNDDKWTITSYQLVLGL